MRALAAQERALLTWLSGVIGGQDLQLIAGGERAPSPTLR
jgi:hypothetical protein